MRIQARSPTVQKPDKFPPALLQKRGSDSDEDYLPDGEDSDEEDEISPEMATCLDMDLVEEEGFLPSLLIGCPR